MANKPLSEQEINSQQLGDSDMSLIGWLDDKDSPNLRVVFERTSLPISFIFAWVKNLRINLNAKRFRLMTRIVRFDHLPNGGWHVFIDFASDGEIEFDCETINLEQS